MNPFSRINQYILLVGDVIVLYASLILTLWIRYKNLFYGELFSEHLQPFTIIFGVWIIIFYIAGLYDFRSLKNDLNFQKTFLSTLSVCIIIAALLFYVIPYFGITPKTNLIIFFFVFGIINYLWRKLVNTVLAKRGATITKVLVVGSNEITKELINHIQNNPQLGYEVKYWMKEGLEDKEFEHLSQIILANNISTIIIPAHLKKDYEAAKLIYKTLALDIEILDLSSFYELIFNKVPLAELEEVWFLENLARKNRLYDSIKEPIERFLALILFIVLLPLETLIAVLIKISSKGPAIFEQTRVGKGEKEFTIYKFRTMYADAEKHGPQWAKYFDDNRATSIGRFLRKTHLDELPQLINIIKGELSFIGPRPERPEFVSELRNKIPYFELRLLIKPGVTGWAQINFRYGASVEDAYEKVQHDIYYIKNNSPMLDLSILIRTLKFFISNHS